MTCEGRLTDGDLACLLRDVITELRVQEIAAVPVVISRLRAVGIVPNVHVGRKDLTTRETLEWYGGAILDVLESESWWAVNTLINTVDKFAPLRCL